MKSTIFVTLFLFIFNNSFIAAQDVDVFWGKQNPVKLLVQSELIGKKGDVIWGYNRRKKNDLKLTKYSFNDMQIKAEYPIIGSSSGKTGKLIDSKYSFNSFLLIKNKLYIIVSKYDKKTDLNTIYSQEIDDNGKLLGTLKKLGDILSANKRHTGSFDIYVSRDSAKILLVNNPPYKKYAGEKFRFQVFDSNMNQLTNTEISMPYKDKNFLAENYLVSNEGEIFLLAQIELPKKDKKKEEASYYYEIVAVNPTNNEVAEYEIKLPKKSILDVSYSLDDKEKGIICSGFYNNIEVKGRSRDEVNGIFYLRINKDSKAVEANDTKELDKEFIADLTSKKKANKGRGISSKFEIKNFIRKSDGGAIIVAEDSYNYVTTSTSSKGQVTYTYHYVRNNIIAININQTGNIKWYTNIPKLQHTINDNGIFSSFVLATNKDKMYFIYNDNYKNMDPSKVKTEKDIKSMGSFKNWATVMVELTEDGKYTKKTLFTYKETKMLFMPSLYTRINDRQYIVPTMSRGFYCCLIPIKSTKSKLVRFDFK